MNIPYHTIYDKLISLQTVPGAYDEWALYRKQLTDFVIDHTDPFSSAVIVGAGECNDFDLTILNNHFSHLTLLDRDIESVLRGTLHQKIEINKNEIINCDLFGITPMQYRNFCLQMEFLLQKRCLTTQIFCDEMEYLYKKRKPEDAIFSSCQFDTAICCGVHSQLNNMFAQIAEVYSQYTDLDLDEIFRHIRMENDKMIPKVNDLLFRISRKNAILGLEQTRLGIHGDIEGSCQAYHDLFHRKIRFAGQMELLWPWDRKQDKIYQMIIIDAEMI